MGGGGVGDEGEGKKSLFSKQKMKAGNQRVAVWRERIDRNQGYSREGGERRGLIPFYLYWSSLDFSADIAKRKSIIFGYFGPRFFDRYAEMSNA